MQKRERDKLVYEADLEYSIEEAISEAIAHDSFTGLPPAAEGGERCGVPLSTIEKLAKEGTLDQWMSNKFFKLAALCADEFEDRVINGEVDPRTLMKAAHDFASLGLKLSGRDVKKVAVLHGDVLEVAARKAHEGNQGSEP